MSVHALIICFLLGAQAGGSRYSDNNATPNPFAPQGATTGISGTGNGAPASAPIVANGENSGSGVPTADSPPISTTPNMTTPGSRKAGSYNQLNPSLGTGRPPVSPPPASPARSITGGASSAPPPSGQSPWYVKPGAGGPAPADANGEMKPSGMMRAMMSSLPTSELSGTSVRLSDAVVGAQSRSDQTERVEAYWDLCSSVADYYLGLRELDELRGLRSRLPQHGQTWQQAEKELAVRTTTSQAAAVASQYRLASLIGVAGSLPLPVDTPHCGDYRTKYEQVFAGRPSIEAQELANLLPLRYSELQDAATAVTRAEQWLYTAGARSNNPDGDEMRSALELLALRRRAFVQIARDYNRRIARYTELSRPAQVPPELLVNMLILRDGATTAPHLASPDSIYDRQSQIAPGLPKTFVEGWTPASGDELGAAELDSAIRQASGETEADESADHERSVLVNPPDVGIEVGADP